MWDNRSLIIFVIMGILTGFFFGFYIGGIEMSKHIIPLYQAEIKRLQTWNDLLIQGLRPLSPFPGKKGG